MQQWMKTQTPSNDVVSTRWGHGKVLGHKAGNVIRVRFDMGRTCELSFSYYHDKGELDYVCAKPQPPVIEYRDGARYAYGRMDKYLYHLTDLDNMESIISRGLLSRAQLQSSAAGFVDIADREIIHKRGGLENFVPFHFVPNTAFDYVVKRDHPNKQFVYICISRSYARSHESYILLSHPTSNYACRPLDYDAGIRNLDWEAIEDPRAYISSERKQRKMAECITHEPVTADHFEVILVPSPVVAEQIRALYEKQGISCANTRFVIDRTVLHATNMAPHLEAFRC